MYTFMIKKAPKKLSKLAQGSVMETRYTYTEE